MSPEAVLDSVAAPDAAAAAVETHCAQWTERFLQTAGRMAHEPPSFAELLALGEHACAIAAELGPNFSAWVAQSVGTTNAVMMNTPDASPALRLARQAWLATQILATTSQHMIRMTAAQLAAWTTATALCDVSLLQLLNTPQRAATELSRSRWSREHPRVSAALLSIVPGVPSEWPVLVSQHHERIDGTGQPQGLRGHQLSRTSQLIAIARASGAALQTLQGSQRPALMGTALALWCEAQRGGFDRLLVRSILESWQPGLEEKAAAWYQRERLLRVDTPRAVPAPHAARFFAAAATARSNAESKAGRDRPPQPAATVARIAPRPSLGTQSLRPLPVAAPSARTRRAS